MAAALRRTGVRVTSGMTGPYGRLNHFGHPDRDVRRYYVDWFKTFADIIADLGGLSVGTQFAILTYRDYDDPERRHALIQIGDRLLGRGGRAREGGGAGLRLLGADERRARVRRDDRGLPRAAGPADRGADGGADVDDGRHRPRRRDEREPGRLRPLCLGAGGAEGLADHPHQAEPDGQGRAPAVHRRLQRQGQHPAGAAARGLRRGRGAGQRDSASSCRSRSASRTTAR